MADTTRIPGNSLRPAAEITPPIRPADGRTTTKTSPSGASFGELLRARQGTASNAPVLPTAPEVRFSAHAQTRLQSRKISLDSAHLDRLQNAVQRAAGKGSRDALVMMDDLAMVVSVTNRTVVTVVDKDSLKDNVFTNIDSAVIA